MGWGFFFSLFSFLSFHIFSEGAGLVFCFEMCFPGLVANADGFAGDSSSCAVMILFACEVPHIHDVREYGSYCSVKCMYRCWYCCYGCSRHIHAAPTQRYLRNQLRALNLLPNPLRMHLLQPHHKPPYIPHRPILAHHPSPVRSIPTCIVLTRPVLARPVPAPPRLSPQSGVRLLEVRS